MLIAFDLPESYIKHFDELREIEGLNTMEEFCVHAMAIGVKTIEHALKVTRPVPDNVVQFDPHYLDKRKK